MRRAAILLGCRDSEYATPSPSISKSISKSLSTPSGHEQYADTEEEHTSAARMDDSGEEEVRHFSLFMLYVCKVHHFSLFMMYVCDR